jgi:hypothetical protein
MKLKGEKLSEEISEKNIKHSLSMQAQFYSKLDAKFLEYVKSGWLETDEGKSAVEKFGLGNKSKESNE